jgi:hypothetical protein
VEVAPGAKSVTVEVPAMVSTAPRPAVAPQARPLGTRSRVPAYVLGGLGVAAAGVGAYFGVAAFQTEARSKQECNGTQCTPSGVSLNHDARRDALVSDLTFGGAALLLAAGLYFFFRPVPARSTSSPAASLRLWAGDKGGAIGVHAAW